MHNKNHTNIEQDFFNEDLCVFNAICIMPCSIKITFYFHIYIIFKDSNSLCAECLYMLFTNMKKIKITHALKNIRNRSEKDTRDSFFI